MYEYVQHTGEIIIFSNDLVFVALVFFTKINYRKGIYVPTIWCFLNKCMHCSLKLVYMYRKPGQLMSTNMPNTA